ncbi:MAG TPA: lipoyl synthase, partial [Dietzia sp.]|nr:lipoyl synthase [Dietzia sp.]
RSSYRAGRLYVQALEHRGQVIPENLEHLTSGGSASQEASSVLARSRA